MKDYTMYDQPGPEEPDDMDARLVAFRTVRGAAAPEVTRGVTVDPDADDDRGVSNSDIASAVRARLKLAKHIPVTIMDSQEIDFTGRWTIKTTDMAADGSWELAGFRAGNLPEIVVTLYGHTTSLDWHGQNEEPPAQNIVSGLEVDEPSDDDVVELENRMRTVKERWNNMQHYFERSMQRGDVDTLRQARDELPQLGQSLLLLLTAMNRAIERGAQQEEYERRNG